MMRYRSRSQWQPSRKVMPWIGDSYQKRKVSLGDQLPDGRNALSLYAHKCPVCGYTAIRRDKELTCGCGTALTGQLVYYKVQGTVVLDKRYQ